MSKSDKGKINLLKKWKKWFTDFTKPYKDSGDILRDVLICPVAIIFLSVSIISAIYFSFLTVNAVISNLFKNQKDNASAKNLDYFYNASISSFTLGVSLLLLSPLILIKIPMRLYSLLKHGWEPIWQNNKLINKIYKFDLARKNDDTVKQDKNREKIEHLLFKAYDRKIVGTDVYVQTQTSNAALEETQSTSRATLELKEPIDATVELLKARVKIK